MCGIAGTSNLTPLTRDMLRFMAWDIESRGRQSWGITNGIDAYKQLGPVTESFNWPNWLEDGNPVIIHTRSASTGEVTVDNQHPFYATKPNSDPLDITNVIVGVHNGVISNHTAMNKAYDRKFDVDSQHIFAHIAEGKSTAELHGYGNVVFAANLQFNPERTLYLFRFNSQDLHVMRLESGEVVFCSTDHAIKGAANMCGGKITLNYKFPNEELFMLRSTTEGWEMAATGQKLPFGTRYVHNPATHCSSGSRTWHQGYVWDFETCTWQPPTTSATNAARTERYAVGTGRLLDVGARGRYANMCIIDKCLENVNRKTALMCDKHFKQLEDLLDGAA